MRESAGPSHGRGETWPVVTPPGKKDIFSPSPLFERPIGRPRMLRGAHALATVAFLSILTSTVALATAQRTFVASYGNDANVCSLTQPCRGFAATVT